MTSKCDTFPISYVHVDELKELSRVGDYLPFFGGGIVKKYPNMGVGVTLMVRLA